MRRWEDRRTEGDLAVFERSVAGGTEEVVLVVRLVEELLAATRDRLLAVGAVVTEELDVMRLAVRQT